MYEILVLGFMFGLPILMVLGANIIDMRMDKLYPIPTESDQYLIEAYQEIDSMKLNGPKLYTMTAIEAEAKLDSYDERLKEKA